jgi:WhiB family redox-sensing transcriptional regulator
MPEWLDDAACLTTDPELFFTPVLENYAKQICAECPVAKLCLQTALDQNHDSGVWGGLSESERKLMRKTRKAREGKSY